MSERRASPPAEGVESAGLLAHRSGHRRLLTLAAASAALTALLLRADTSRSALQVASGASPLWLALCVAAIAGTYLCAAVVMTAASMAPLRTRPTLVAQLAVAFANRLAPAGLGGAALSVRYLERSGARRADALAAVAASNLSVLAVHLVAFIALAPFVPDVPVGVHLGRPQAALLAVIGAAVLTGVVTTLWRLPGVRPARPDGGAGPPGRLEGVGTTLAAVVSRRGRCGALLGGSAAIMVLHGLAVWTVLRSVGAASSLVGCLVIYLVAAAVGALSPTPGGLGGIEATLVAGLVATATPPPQASAAVMLYHLLAFWLPVLPGAVAFSRLRRAELL